LLCIRFDLDDLWVFVEFCLDRFHVSPPALGDLLLWVDLIKDQPNLSIEKSIPALLNYAWRDPVRPHLPGQPVKRMVLNIDSTGRISSAAAFAAK
jgi:hypothetical protein